MTTENIISELKDREISFTWSKQERENWLENKQKNPQILETWGKNDTVSNSVTIWVAKDEKQWGWNNLRNNGQKLHNVGKGKKKSKGRVNSNKINQKSISRYS